MALGRQRHSQLSFRHALTRATRAKTKHPSVGGGSCRKEGLRPSDLPTLPPAHPAEGLPVGWNYALVATPARADAVGSKPSLPALTHPPAPWAVCPRVRIGRRCGMRFMSLRSDVVVGKTCAESLPPMGEKAQAFLLRRRPLAGKNATPRRLFAADFRVRRIPQGPPRPHPPLSGRKIFFVGRGALDSQPKA